MKNYPESTAWLPWLLAPPSPTDAQTLAVLQQLDWPTVTAMALRHQLAPLLYVRLRTAGLLDHLPPVAVADLKRAYHTSALQSLLRERQLRRLLAALAAVGVRPALFKGAALAHTIYPEPACRPMGDIDLWVADAQIALAQQTIAALGYQQRINAERPLALQSQWDGEIKLFSQRKDESLVELHWGVFAGGWLQWTAHIDRAGVEQRLRPTTVVGQPALLLAPEDALIQVAVHLTVNHNLSTNGLRSLVDVGLLAQQGLDWEVVVARARAWRLATAVGEALRLAATFFDRPDLLRVSRELAPGRMRRAWLERFSADLASPTPLTLAQSRWRFVYLLCLVDAPQGVANLLRHTLWPDAAWLIARYGQSGAGVRWRHWGNILRSRNARI